MKLSNIDRAKQLSEQIARFRREIDHVRTAEISLSIGRQAVSHEAIPHVRTAVIQWLSESIQSSTRELVAMGIEIDEPTKSKPEASAA